MAASIEATEMGDFENVPELRGTENYYEWRRQTEQLLLGEGVYSHVSRGTNPFSYVDFASYMPRPANPFAPTVEEREAIETWQKADGKAKSIIMRKISSTVLTLILDNILTARDIWTILANHFDQTDVSLQFTLKSKLAGLQMNGASDAEKYVTAHIYTNDRLARIGAKPSETEAIYVLLRGLPKGGLWSMIRKGIETDMERSYEAMHRAEQMRLLQPQMQVPLFTGASTASVISISQVPPSPHQTGTHRPLGGNPFQPGVFPTASHPGTQSGPAAPPATYLMPPTYSFHRAAQTILREAVRMLDESTTLGPGPEYASAAIGGSSGLGSINPATGLRRTKNNPTGTPCYNQICVNKGSQDGHNLGNCFQEGGGKAGQAPWQRKKLRGQGSASTASSSATTGTSLPLQEARHLLPWEYLHRV